MTPTPHRRLDFATLVDAAEDRLPQVARDQVNEQLERADQETKAAASWIRSFLDAARRHRREQVPDRVRTYLQRHYTQWWSDRSRLQPEIDWDGLAARLVFDSRRAVNLVGVRGVHTSEAVHEAVQLAYALADLDVVIDLASTADGALRVEGQLLTSESHPQVTPLGVVLRGTDEPPRQTDLDHLNRFAFEPVYGPDLELLVRVGRSRWRLPLDAHRIR